MRRHVREYIEASEPERLAWLTSLPDAALLAFFRSELAPHVAGGLPLPMAESADVARARVDLALRTGPLADARHRLAVALAAEGDRRQSTT